MRITYFVMELSIWDMDPDARRRAGIDQFLDFDPVSFDSPDDEPSQPSRLRETPGLETTGRRAGEPRSWS